MNHWAIVRREEKLKAILSKINQVLVSANPQQAQRKLKSATRSSKKMTAAENGAVATADGAKKRKTEDAVEAVEHKGFGKLILFGEHFVVYKKPALVGAVKAATVAEVELSPEGVWSQGLIVEDDRPAVPGYKDKKAEEMFESTRLVLKHFDLDSNKRGVKVILKGDLAPVSGIGASAGKLKRSEFV